MKHLLIKVKRSVTYPNRKIDMETYPVFFEGFKYPKGYYQDKRIDQARFKELIGLHKWKIIRNDETTMVYEQEETKPEKNTQEQINKADALINETVFTQ